MKFDAVISTLQGAFEGEMPGSEAHLKMAPFPGRLIKPAEGKLPRQSGVLVLVYPENTIATVVFILRPTYNGVHSGQVAFPGGRREDTDNNLIETALREANEELAIQPEKVKLLGQLSELYIPPSNSLVSPTVGFSSERPKFVPDKREVAKVIEVPVSHFIYLTNRMFMDVETSMGTLKNVPYYSFGTYKIWGATAMMLSELAELLREK